MVFKVERNSVEFEAELSSGSKCTLTFFELNARQLKELGEEASIKENIEVSFKQLGENLKGDGKEEFINDLLENGSLESFYTAMAEAMKKKREGKRKN